MFLWRALPGATVLGAAVVIARPLCAQCPDGSPPPCRTQVVAAAAPKRVNPPLDERTWIVVPFDNLANSSDVDWLRTASVNLLYLDMSRWRDIRVVDDERVADLMREVPEASGASKALSLNAGLAVAKRAGAGKLVMGDVLKLGSRTAVTAKVFDVKTGQRVKSVREETQVQDSVMSLFGKLAQKVLNVAPPAGANVGAIGTTRVDAYQEYIAGVASLNRFDLPEARQHFEAALKLDSAFALAHYKISIVAGWENANSAERRPHAEAAARLGTGLPARERTLIAGQLAQSRNEWTKACEIYRPLAIADSSDVEAWYGWGECLFHDPTVEGIAGDTTRLRFRADLDASLRAFQHVLDLDPAYHLAYQHIIDALVSERHNDAQYCVEQRCQWYSAMLVRTGDSLVQTPFRVVRGFTGTMIDPSDMTTARRQMHLYAQSGSRRRNLDRASEVAMAWVAADPSELRARAALGRVLLAKGEIDSAGDVLARAGSGGGSIPERLQILFGRIEVAYKQGRAGEAIRLYDSLRASTLPVPGGAFRFGNAMAGYGPAFGRMVEFDSLVAAQVRNAPPYVAPYQRHAIPAAFVGVVSDSLPLVERAAFDQASAAIGRSQATRMIAASLSYALRAPRPSWPAVDTSLMDVKLGPAIALARGDTARLRAAARVLDSLEQSVVATAGSDSGFALIAADAYLVLRDSLAALRVLRLALDNAMRTTALFPLSNAQNNEIYIMPRMMLLRADLARALNYRDEARAWYERFAALWATASPAFQPLVERARRAAAELRG